MAGLQRHLADRNPLRREQVRRLLVLHRPTSCLELLIDEQTGARFGGQAADVVPRRHIDRLSARRVPAR
jgi:hypothetical protein